MSEAKVPEGYKQTEVGVIPEDWEVKNFGELFESSIPRKTIKSSNLVTFVGMQDVTENAQLAHQTIISHERVKSGFTYFEKGDVLLAKITPCFENGKGCHTKGLKTKYGFGSTEFHVLRANSASDSKFIYFWTTRSRFRIDLESAMVGSAGHRRVPFSEVRSYQIPCPTSKSEQTAIATALSDVDNLIQSLEKLITKKEAIKTGTMQQLLTGKTRLPDFATREDGSAKGLKQTELGRIPEDWEISPMSALTTLMTNGFVGTAKSHYTDASDGVLYIQGYNVKENSFNFHGIKRVTQSFHIKNSKSCLQTGDVLMVQTGDVGMTTIVPPELEHSNCHALIINRFKKSMNPKYFSYYFNSSKGRSRLKEIEVGTTMKHINVGNLLDFQVSYPCLEEQTAIATILSDMDAEIQALHQRLEKTKDIKQGMMQQLLTGKVRLLDSSAKSDTQTLASKGELQA